MPRRCRSRSSRDATSDSACAREIVDSITGPCPSTCHRNARARGSLSFYSSLYLFVQSTGRSVSQRDSLSVSRSINHSRTHALTHYLPQSINQTAALISLRACSLRAWMCVWSKSQHPCKRVMRANADGVGGVGTGSSAWMAENTRPGARLWKRARGSTE
eukprot:1474718-Rhodomonas_salina.1